MDKVCTIEGCSGDMVARGYCHKHWSAWRKHGDPRGRANARGLSPEDTLDYYSWSVTDDGCWEWNGSRLLNGYGRMQVSGKTEKVHRYVYRTRVGPIPEGHVVRHKCDNPPCINPEHLETGTHQDNMDDKVIRGRAKIPSGEAHYNTRLTETDVRNIRRLWSEGMSRAEISTRYDVTASNVWQIIKRKTWRHI